MSETTMTTCHWCGDTHRSDQLCYDRRTVTLRGFIRAIISRGHDTGIQRPWQPRKFYMHGFNCLLPEGDSLVALGPIQCGSGAIIQGRTLYRAIT